MTPLRTERLRNYTSGAKYATIASRLPSIYMLSSANQMVRNITTFVLKVVIAAYFSVVFVRSEVIQITLLHMGIGNFAGCIKRTCLFGT